MKNNIQKKWEIRKSACRIGKEKIDERENYNKMVLNEGKLIFIEKTPSDLENDIIYMKEKIR